MTMVGDVVKVGVHGDVVAVARCPAAQQGWWHLVWKIMRNGSLVPVYRVEKASTLRLIAAAPVYRVSERISYQGSPARILEDHGDNVSIAVGVTKIEISKADLVLDHLTEKENANARA